MSNFAIFLFLVLSASSNAVEVDIGVVSESSNEFRHHAVLAYFPGTNENDLEALRYFCSATLISMEHVLTAYGCTTPDATRDQSWFDALFSSGQVFAVSGVHSRCEGSSQDPNRQSRRTKDWKYRREAGLALASLESPFEETERVSPVRGMFPYLVYTGSFYHEIRRTKMKVAGMGPYDDDGVSDDDTATTGANYDNPDADGYDDYFGRRESRVGDDDSNCVLRKAYLGKWLRKKDVPNRREQTLYFNQTGEIFCEVFRGAGVMTEHKSERDKLIALVTETSCASGEYTTALSVRDHYRWIRDSCGNCIKRLTRIRGPPDESRAVSLLHSVVLPYFCATMFT